MLYRVLSIAILMTLFLGSVQAANSVVVDQKTRDKVLSEYTLLTRDAIQQAWTTPVAYDAEKAVKGKTTVSYVITRDGKVERVKLIKGSGNAEMDHGLIKAIKRAPFPAFPSELQADKVTIKANFVIADPPTLPVITANHELGRVSDQLSETSKQKRFIWGLPAGSAETASQESVDDPPRPPSKKYKWGL